MQCPVCGNETINVISNPKRGERSDLRTVKCSDCGSIYAQVTQLTDIYIWGNPVSLAKAHADGTINRLGDEYMKIKNKSKNRDNDKL